MGETEETNFTLEAWAHEHSVSKKTLTNLRKEECDSLLALKLLTAKDVNRLNVTMGQARLLRLALRAIGNPISLGDDQAPSETKETSAKRGETGEGGEDVVDNPDVEDQGQILNQAGKELEQLLNDAGQEDDPEVTSAAEPAANRKGIQPGGSGYGKGYGDPLMLLTVKANTHKALQILNFLPETVRTRINRRK